MTEFTKKEMLDNFEAQLKKTYPDFNYSLSKEDGYTKITLWGNGITPKSFDFISQEIANATQREFYFNMATSDAIQGFLNAKFNYLEHANDFNSVPERHDDGIKEYGQEFSPKAPSKKAKIK